jgi:uncharacterized protein YegL
MDISAYVLSNDETSSKGGILLKGLNRTTRQSVHIIMLVDTSGSMEDNGKLESVKKSLRFMLSLLSSDDRLSLITFDNDATLILDKVVPDAANLDATLYKIDMLHVNGSTNMSAGLLEARSVIEAVDSGRKQGIILLTDGHANVGSSTPDAIVSIIQRILTDNRDVSISTTGYGSDHNADLLMQVAREGGGAYNVVSNLEDVASTFGDILGGLVSVSAQRVQVKFPAAYTVKTSYPTQISGHDTVVNVGDVYAETEITILFDMAGSAEAVQILGTNMMTLNPIDTTLVPQIVSLEAYPLAFTVGELKMEVSNMLKAVRSLTVTIGMIDALRDKIVDIVHPIVPFLLADLDQAKLIVRRGRMTQEDAVDLTQHSAYIGTSRGMRSMTSPQRQARFSNEIENDPVAPRQMLSPMANAAQRSMTGAMRSLTGGGAQ